MTCELPLPPAQLYAIGLARGAGVAGRSSVAQTEACEPIVLAAQGSYAAGGTVMTAAGAFDPRPFFQPAGGQNHGDHAYVRYQTPVRARALPLVLWHGGGQAMRTWETTPDGREGFQSILLRGGWETHLLDQPRRGGAGHPNTIAPMAPPGPMDRALWHIFRLGVYPDFFPGVQFSPDPEALNQFWRQRTDDTGPEVREIIASAVSAIFDRIGDGVLITHSGSGKWGFVTAGGQPRIKAVVSYEPTNVVVPEGYEPRQIDVADPTVRAITTPLVVSPEHFAQLARVPIQIVMGDNIPSEASPYAGFDLWRVVAERVREFRDLINSEGGDCTILDLPAVGLSGNTHFPFSDLNNLAVAEQLFAFLASRGLDA
jgi:hypothetical protein